VKYKYTDQDISLFYERFKQLPEYFELEKVHQLINNPNAKATHRVSFNYKPFNFKIMTSAFIIVMSALLFWQAPKKSDKTNSRTEKQIVQSESSYQDMKVRNDIQSVVKVDPSIMNESKSNSSKVNVESSIISNNEIIGSDIETNHIIEKSKSVVSNLTWPCDTTIDSETMLVKLTPQELLEIGIIVKNGKFHYHNKTPHSFYDMEFTSLPENERIITNNDFYAWAFSSLSCDEFTLGGPQFYETIDTLVPIVVEAKKTQIFWFTPTKSLFSKLPDRYSYIETVIKNVQNLKKTCPQKTYINYWSQGVSVFDKINFIELSKAELEKIQFKISNDKLVVSDKDDINRLELYSNSSHSMKGIDSKLPFPPNPFPMAITDTLGRGRYFPIYAKAEQVNRDYIIKNINTLIPVRVNLEEIIPPRKETLVFWFYPTDEFINALPDRIKYDLKSELDAINDGTFKSTSSCKYFEACKSTLTLDDLKVYPNPVNQNISIEFSIPNSLDGHISLINISGVQVKSIISQRTFNSGMNLFNANLSDVPPGVYLISITTENGFKTQRIIVSR
jgi:hypothetical protein